MGVPLALAVPPANDAQGGAAQLKLNLPVSGTTVDAVDDYQLSGAGCFTGIGQVASTAPGADVVYRFTAPTAGSYSFRMSRLSITNPVLYVASSLPSGSPTVTGCLAAANRSAGLSEEVSSLPLAAGQTVFVVADAHDAGEGTFDLVVERATLESGTNDTPGTTTSTTGCGKGGAISPAADADFFQLGSPAADSRLFAMADGAAGSTSDFDLRATTAADTLEYDDHNLDSEFGQSSGVIAGRALTGTQAFLRVSHLNPAAVEEPYRLYSVIQPPFDLATAETEPNDTTETASASSDNYASGTLAGTAPSADVDLYAVTVPARTLLFVGLDADPVRNNTPVDATLDLLGPAGNLLVSANDGGSASSTTSGTGSLTSTTPDSPAEGLVYRARTAGTYYVRVRIGTTSITSIGAGDYLLSAAINCTAGLPPAITPAPATMPDATQGVPYSQTLTASGGTGPHTFDIETGALPPGLTLAANGTVSGTPTATGGFGFRVLATDANEFTGGRDHTIFVNEPPPASIDQSPVVAFDDSIRPSFLSARLTRRRWRVDTGARAETPVAALAPTGTTFRYRLSEASRVVFTIQRALPGRRVGRRCVAPKRSNRRRKRCTRYRRVGRFSQSSPAGSVSKRFSGKIGRKRLSPGRYRATLVALDEAGNRSRARRLKFTIVRR